MIDLKALRENPEKYRQGAHDKRVAVDIDRIVHLDNELRKRNTAWETLRFEQKRLSNEGGREIGRLSVLLKAATGDEKTDIERQIFDLKHLPSLLKNQINDLSQEIGIIQQELDALLLLVPQPPDHDVPKGKGSEDNVPIRHWAPAWWDQSKSFEANKGFAPKTHIQLVHDLKLVDFERGVKIAGSRNYVLTGDGMRLHQAALRYAFDYMVSEHGFAPRSVPVLVREEAMLGTGFFPHGKEQSYHIEESARGGGHDLYLTGTGEVGLMGLHQGEILSESDLPLKYVTVSPCFRREAGAAGKDTAGLYRIHSFDKVEQVVITRADEAESRDWHKKMIGFVELLLQRLELPHRLLQCCTGDLGVKNADMVDIECWMPGRGEVSPGGVPAGDWGETHSASRLYDFQCRRLGMRYRAGGEGAQGQTVFCHSLNNTVLASPRFLIPLLEMHQNADGSVTIPKALRPYMNNQERIG